MIKNLILDIGNVICVWDSMALCASAFDDPIEQQIALQATIEQHDWKELDRGVISRETALANAIKRCSLDANGLAAIYENLPSSFLPIETTVAAMNRAAAAGVPMYVLSNMALPSWQWIKSNVACFGLCNGIVISGEVQLIKPNPDIYHYLCNKFSLQPEECVFIDDMQENIDAAVACGWRGELLSDKSKGGELIDKLVAEITS
jgi:putative hydrolase of the HAD superfamily